MGEEVLKSVEPYFLHSSMQDFLIFKYVLQIILAFGEKVAARSPIFSVERKASVK